MKVCLVVVTYNRFEVLAKTINCILQQTYPVDYFIVVDNGSVDDTVAKLKSYGHQVDTLSVKDNQGYGAGLSLGMKYARSKHTDITYFWLMDDDSFANPELLQVLLDERSKLNTPGLISLLGFIDTFWSGPVRLYNYHDKDAFKVSDSNLYSVDHALIDGALVDNVVVDQIGTPREDLFMMCEDVEYCKRIKRAGFDIFSMANSNLMSRLHLGGGEQFSKGTLWRGYYHSRNHLVILKNYFSTIGLASYCLRQIKFLISALVAKDRFRRIGFRLLGIFHGLIGKMGKTIDPAKI